MYMSHHHYASPFKLLAHTSTYTPACAHATHAEREPLRVVFRLYSDIRSYMLKDQEVQSETRFTNACVRDCTFVFTQYSHTCPCACVAHIHACACACVTVCVYSLPHAQRQGERERGREAEEGSSSHVPASPQEFGCTSSVSSPPPTTPSLSCIVYTLSTRTQGPDRGVRHTSN